MALSRVRLSRRASASPSLGALLCVIGCDGENSSSSLFFPMWWAVLLLRLTTAWRYVTQAQWCRNDSSSTRLVVKLLSQRYDVCTEHRAQTFAFWLRNHVFLCSDTLLLCETGPETRSAVFVCLHFRVWALSSRFLRNVDINTCRQEASGHFSMWGSHRALVRVGAV